MLARSHVAVACATWSVIATQSVGADMLGGIPGVDRIGGLAITLGLVALGALLPDIDNPRSYLARLPLGKRGLLRSIRALVPVAQTVHAEFGHRGALHSIAATVLLVLVLQNVVAPSAGIPALGYAVGWGYLSHIAADGLTRYGVPLLWPISRRRFAIPRPFCCATGGIGEAIYVGLIVFGAAAVLLLM